MYLKDNGIGCSPYPASISIGSLNISTGVQTGEMLSHTEEGNEVVDQIEVTENLKGGKITDYYPLSFGKSTHIDTTNYKIHKNTVTEDDIDDDADDDADERTVDFVGNITVKEDETTEITGVLYIKDKETNKFIPRKIQIIM